MTAPATCAIETSRAGRIVPAGAADPAHRHFWWGELALVQKPL